MLRLVRRLRDAARWSLRQGAVLVFALGLAACGDSGPVPIAYGQDGCDYCRMQISDPRYGGEVVTRTGKALKFDSVECLASYYAGLTDRATVRSTWVSDYQRPGTLIPAADARFVHFSGPGGSPMGRGLLAVSPESNVAALAAQMRGEVLSWSDVVVLVEREGLHPDSGTTGGSPAHDVSAHAPAH